MGWDVGAKLFRSSSEAVGGSARPRGGYLKQPICLWKILMLLMASRKSARKQNQLRLGSLKSHHVQGFTHPRWCRTSKPSTGRPYLEDHPGTSRWLRTMVMVSFRPGRIGLWDPFQMVIESFMYYFHAGWSDHHLLAEMIFQIISSWWFQPKLKNMSQIGNLSQFSGWT